MGDVQQAIEITGKCSDLNAVQRVLVVDDSRALRRILLSSLNRWGFDVFEAGSGQEALEICRSQDIDLVVSDWMMPGMNGLEFCKEFRALERNNYGYFILLTSNSEKKEVAHGLDVGADDFLTKPVSANELHARIRAADRILSMERELSEKNRLVSKHLAELSGLYDALDRDLIEARGLQQALVRERFKDLGCAHLSLMLHPSGHVGGDLVGHFPISTNQIGLFAIDVSGHGVASALMTARLASYFSGSTQEQNIALTVDAAGETVARSPAEVARSLNEILLEQMETELYFTLSLGNFNLSTGQVVMVQCGHPHTVVQRTAGDVEFTGSGGLPVGLIPGAKWQDYQFLMHPGDRVLMTSDGITECPDPGGNMLEEAGLEMFMRQHTDLHGTEFFEALMWELTRFSGDQDFPDDISAILLEYSGASIE